MEYYSVLKRNELLSHEEDMEKPYWNTTKWKASLNKLRTVWFQLCDILEKGKTMETVNESIVAME